MNKRQVIILWIIAAVLAVTVALVKLSQQAPTESATNRSPGELLLEDFPAAEVTRIHIDGSQRDVTLKQAGDGWVVAQRDDYPADTRSVLEFLRTIEQLKVTRAIEAGPSFAPRFGMDADADLPADHGLTITFSAADGEPVATITLGKNIENASSGSLLGGAATVGRYLRNHADESGFYASSELFPSIDSEPSGWLDDTFISPAKIKSVTLSQPDSDEPAWSMTRESEEAEFQLADPAPGEVANATSTRPLKSLFSYTRFEDVAPADEVEPRRADKGVRKASLETFEGFTYDITLIPQKGVDDRFLMQVGVAADLPTERKKEEGESEEDAKTRDEAFAKRLGTLQDKLNKAETYKGRTFIVTKTTLNPLLKERGEMVTQAAPEKEDDGKSEDDSKDSR